MFLFRHPPFRSAGGEHPRKGDAAMTNKVRLAAAGGLLTAAVLAAPHPRADLTILAHQAGDPSPHRAELAFDVGLLAGRLLVTWTASTLAR